MSDLTIPATRELLDGWCGPVLTPAMVAAGVDEGSVHVGHIIGDHARVYGWSNDWYRIGSLSLPLARAEVYDRVYRVLLGDCDRPSGAQDGCVWCSATLAGHRGGRCIGTESSYYTPLNRVLFVACLLDGSRRVDVEALRLAWLAREAQR